jgi:hypothetical protein
MLLSIMRDMGTLTSRTPQFRLRRTPNAMKVRRIRPRRGTIRGASSEAAASANSILRRPESLEPDGFSPPQ